MEGKEELVTNLLARIDVMAVKLGIAAEHLWEIMVRQAIISGVIELITLGIFTMIVGIYFRAFIEKRLYDRVESEPTPAGVAVIVATIIVVIMTIAVLVQFCELGGIVTKIFNPEYWAYQSLLGNLK